MGFDETWAKMWEKGRKVDPLTHRAIEAVVKQDSKGVREASRGLAKVFGGDDTWLGARFNDLGDEADKNVQDPKRGVGRAAATVGLLYGGYSLMGGGAGAGVGAGEAAAGGGAVAGPGLSATVTGPTGSGMVAGATGGGTGSGLSTAGTTAGGWSTSLSNTGLGSAGAGVNWAQMGDAASDIGNSMQQQPDPRIEESRVQVEQPDLNAVYGISSKQAKRAPDGGAAQAMQRGAAGADPIDENGLHMAAIQALTKRAAALRAELQQLKGA